MIERNISLASTGSARTSGCDNQLRLGYSSIHYFSKSFNMKYHMSPSEFVKQNCQSSV
jgi:methylphosphotriester-DNA--protein-cysteine methyltransferase